MIEPRGLVAASSPPHPFASYPHSFFSSTKIFGRRYGASGISSRMGTLTLCCFPCSSPNCRAVPSSRQEQKTIEFGPLNPLLTPMILESPQYLTGPHCSPLASNLLRLDQTMFSKNEGINPDALIRPQISAQYDLATSLETAIDARPPPADS